MDGDRSAHPGHRPATNGCGSTATSTTGFPENYELLASRLRGLSEVIAGGSQIAVEQETLQFHDGTNFQRVLLAKTAAGEIVMRHEATTQDPRHRHLLVLRRSRQRHDSTRPEAPFPTSPIADQLHEFNQAASAIVAKDFDGLTDITSAVRGDVFKFNGVNWIKQSEGEPGDGTLSFTRLTGADKSFTAPVTIASGQFRELFDSDITFPADAGDDDVVMLEVQSNAGINRIFISKGFMAELLATAPVTLVSSSTVGTTAVLVPGATRNAYLFPLGQNRGFLLGYSNEATPRLLWAARTRTASRRCNSTRCRPAVSHPGSGGQQAPAPGVTQLTAGLVRSTFYAYAHLGEGRSHVALALRRRMERRRPGIRGMVHVRGYGPDQRDARSRLRHVPATTCRSPPSRRGAGSSTTPTATPTPDGR